MNETMHAETTPLRRLTLTHRGAAKALVFLLTVLVLLATLLSALGAALMVSGGVFTTTQAQLRHRAMDAPVEQDVLDLMNNICKYAQPGTRVYLTLEKRDGQAVISFKNISRQALDVSEEALLERFVRGDAARSSEGNGLGLSIAQSLTQLQNGHLELTVDGDLFKVVLSFPALD